MSRHRIFPLSALPLSFGHFSHCPSAFDFVLRFVPSWCEMAAAASSITPHTTLSRARRENIFFFFLEKRKFSQMTLLVSHWLEMDQICKLTTWGRGEWNYCDWLSLTQVLLSEPLILGPTGGV